MDAQVKKIMTELKAKKYAPVYFLQGEESYYIDLISDYIEAHVLSDSEKSFNQVVVYGKDVAMATILTHARRFPMMAERQVVIVKEAQEIQDLGKDTGAKLLLDYVNKPVPSTVLVFCHKNKSLDKRKELGKKIDKLTECVTTRKPYDNQLPDFVREYASGKKISIEDRAVQSLCEFVGNDLSRLTNEFDKLCINLKDGEPITADRVMSQVGISKEYNIFELQRAIVHRDTLLATKIVNYFESNSRRNPIIPVVAFLYSFFTKLLIATTAQDKSDKGLLSALKISPYAVKDYTLALRHYNQQKVTENISYLKEAD
ncbi:MAG: DNA polymerase III subunit delta, partial [Flammeovirgaceae bacterium]|nr:DNA polymerase III subunit delta [Flammeovirgaceae bacterium]